MGLLRGIARTAVVAGTATAVSNRVSRRQAGRWAQQSAPPAQEYYEDPGDQGMDSKLSQLRELGDLKSQGVLTEEEFQRQKQQILNQ
jgi:hypothetical protein